MIIDMHMHVQGRSGCSIMPFDDIFNHISPMIDAICITDHEIVDPIKGVEHYEPKVFFGVEILTDKGDILVYGIEKLPKRPFKANLVIDFVHDNNGVVVCAHPFSRRHYAFGDEVHDFNFDAIEVNGAIHKNENQEAKMAAKRMILPLIGGSDSHSVNQLNTIATIFEGPISSIKDIVSAIKQGTCKPIKLR